MEKLVVLVVDDEPGIRSGVHRILRNFTVGYPFMDEDIAYDVLEAPTGEDAIDIIQNQHVDIVLLDNKLPGIKGIEVLEFINSQKMDILVMMITSYASLELAVKATNHGAYDFVPKPFTPQELRSSLETSTKHLFLKRMTKNLKKEGKQIRFQFLSMLSHELKAPLNAIEGYLKIMEEKQVGDSIDSYMSMIDRSLDRVKGMRNLIMDLLDLTHIVSGKKKREIQELDLIRIAETAIDTMKPYAIQMDIEIQKEFCKESLIYNGDIEEIEIIFNNLISNAVKYNNKGGKVRIIICIDEQNAIITVKDTGIGMTEKEMEKLFDEFVRIKNEKTKNISGSGLGLSIVKNIVDIYKGKIKVSSTAGEGSEFKVILPILEAKK